MASRSGILIFHLIEYFYNLFHCALDLLHFSLFRKGTIGLCTSSADFSFSFSPFSKVFSLEFVDEEASFELNFG